MVAAGVLNRSSKKLDREGAPPTGWEGAEIKTASVSACLELPAWCSLFFFLSNRETDEKSDRWEIVQRLTKREKNRRTKQKKKIDFWVRAEYLQKGS